VVIVALLASIAILCLAVPSAASAHTGIQNSFLPLVFLQTSPIPPLSAGCGFLESSIAATVQKNAPWYCPINSQIYYYWKNEIPLALLAVMLSVTIASLVFMIGASFKIKALRDFGAAEFYEAFASALIVSMFMFVSAALFGLVPSLFVGTINPYATALHLISQTISYADNVLHNLFQAYIVTEFIRSVSVTIQVRDLPIVSATAGILQSFAKLCIAVLYSAPAWVLFGFIVDGVYALYLEYYLIIFFAIAAIPAFLVPGVLFRTMLPTRPLGGILISVAIGFYLIMPTLFAVAFNLTSPQLNSELVVAAHYLSLYDIGSAFGSCASLGLLNATTHNLQAAMTGFWLLILFYPALIVSITYAFITQFAEIIGGVAYSAGKLRGLV